MHVHFDIRGLWTPAPAFPRVSYRASSDGRRAGSGLLPARHETATSILDPDYYVRRCSSLAELETNPEFPEIADTAPFRRGSARSERPREFFSKFDLAAPKMLAPTSPCPR